MKVVFYSANSSMVRESESESESLTFPRFFFMFYFFNSIKPQFLIIYLVFTCIENSLSRAEISCSSLSHRLRWLRVVIVVVVNYFMLLLSA